jgi:putative DNA primase/helicase
MRPVELFLSRVDKPRKAGKSHQACCPAHNDKSPSLTISEADNGDLLLHCFAGCEYRDIMAAVGLEAKEGFQGSLSPESKREYQVQTLTKARQFERLVMAAAATSEDLSDDDVARLATARQRIQEIDQQLSAPAVPLFSRGGYDLHSPLPFCTEKGKPLKHIDNLKEIVNRCNVTLRYNVIAKEEEIIIPGASFSIDNMGNASLAWLKSECSLFGFSTDQLDGMVTYLSDQNQYNPVAEWVLSRKWDGVPRMQSLYDTVTAVGEFEQPSNKTLKETLIKRWMMSAIAAAFLPDGVSAAGVLVFQGAQYLGKTKWFKTLVPEELGLLKDGMLLRPDDKDSVKQICSFWLVELGELDSTFRKADIAALKSFITNKSDVLRRAYARKESHFARRTVFFGSVNPREFLHDTTGNRRYWTIECEKLDHSHEINMQQVWAEAYEMWKQGEGWYLEHEEMEMLNCNNEQFMALDPIEERIREYLDWDCPESSWRWEQVTQLLIECGVDRPNMLDASKAGGLIRKINGNRGKRSNGKTLLYVPPKKFR